MKCRSFMVVIGLVQTQLAVGHEYIRLQVNCPIYATVETMDKPATVLPGKKAVYGKLVFRTNGTIAKSELVDINPLFLGASWSGNILSLSLRKYGGSSYKKVQEQIVSELVSLNLGPLIGKPYEVGQRWFGENGFSVGSISYDPIHYDWDGYSIFRSDMKLKFQITMDDKDGTSYHIVHDPCEVTRLP
jgi:hypothetical protein